MIPEEIKHKIDNMSYESMLSRWRHSPTGDPMFIDEIGEYFAKVMKEKQENIGHDAAVAASKSVGW